MSLKNVQAPEGIAGAVLGLRALSSLRITATFTAVSQVEAFVAELVEHCPLTQKLELGARLPPLEEKLGFGSFRPLLGWSALAELWLPVQLDEEDIAKMGQAWPRLTTLTLPDTTLPVSTLSVFARHFQRLQMLGIKIIWPTPPTFNHTTPQFASLQTLNTRTSSLPPPYMNQPVAGYLAWVCPPGVEVINYRLGASAAWAEIVMAMRTGHALQQAAVRKADRLQDDLRALER